MSELTKLEKAEVEVLQLFIKTKIQFYNSFAFNHDHSFKSLEVIAEQVYEKDLVKAENNIEILVKNGLIEKRNTTTIRYKKGKEIKDFYTHYRILNPGKTFLASYLKREEKKNLKTDINYIKHASLEEKAIFLFIADNTSQIHYIGCKDISKELNIKFKNVASCLNLLIKEKLIEKIDAVTYVSPTHYALTQRGVKVFTELKRKSIKQNKKMEQVI